MELLVVIAIMAILLAAGIVSYGSVTKRSRDAKRKADLEQIRQALELYRADNLMYPDCTGHYISVCMAQPGNEGFATYMSTIPTDPRVAADVNFNYRYQRISPTQYCVKAFMEIEAGTSLPAGCTAPAVTPAATQTYSLANP